MRQLDLPIIILISLVKFKLIRRNQFRAKYIVQNYVNQLRQLIKLDFFKAETSVK